MLHKQLIPLNLIYAAMRKNRKNPRFSRVLRPNPIDAHVIPCYPINPLAIPSSDGRVGSGSHGIPMAAPAIKGRVP
jgi:hypothetical protein